MSEVLLTENIGPIRRLTMNRPDKLNSLNAELLDAISSAGTGSGWSIGWSSIRRPNSRPS